MPDSERRKMCRAKNNFDVKVWWLVMGMVARSNHAEFFNCSRPLHSATSPRKAVSPLSAAAMACLSSGVPPWSRERACFLSAIADSAS